jgi:hypothetical protein
MPKFIRLFLCYSLIPVFLAGAVNLMVDPLQLLPMSGVAGLSANKPMLRDQERLFKPYAIARLQPQAVIFGSSRSNHALDPEHRAWQGLRAYNFSVSGTNMEETRKLFEHALATASVERAVIELDLGLFAHSNAAQRQTSEYLATLSSANMRGRWLTVFKTALAWNTLGLSVGTIKGQNGPVEYTNLGRQTDRVFTTRINTYGGVRNTFENYMQRLAPAEQQQAHAWDHAGLRGGRLPGMLELREMMQWARERRIDLRLYISPIHAIDLETQQSIYGWQQIEDWKRALLEAANAEYITSGGTFQIPLWDFSGYNSVTTEAIPASPDRDTRMSYYWDQSHYRQQVGDWILERMYDLKPAGQPAPEDFGVRLSFENLEQHFAEQRSGSQDYVSHHPVEAAFVSSLTHTQ